MYASAHNTTDARSELLSCSSKMRVFSESRHSGVRSYRLKRPSRRCGLTCERPIVALKPRLSIQSGPRAGRNERSSIKEFSEWARSTPVYLMVVTTQLSGHRHYLPINTDVARPDEGCAL